ncbi:MAG: efflux RND transporter periplasmic adaptor subunit [Acidobacteria bacterium]|nr:efflux RND transporter periplasmic adaptor subunit [Acidobacteriota bacterium]
MAIQRAGMLGAGCVLSLALAGCQRGTAPPAFERPPAPVAVVAAITKDVPIYLDEIGKCAAREVVTVQPQVSGRITKIHFADGADLKKGDALFTIDPRPFQAELAAAEATLAQRKAALDLAKIEFSRIADLVDSKAIARQDYDARKNAVDVAEAQVKQSQAVIEAARLNLEYTSIQSPIDGRAGERLVDIGNIVSANSTPLLVIQRLNPIYADFTITESDLTAVQQNMARGSLRVEVRLPDDPDHPRAGQLTFLDHLVQETTGTVKLRATIENGDHRFWPGRFVKVRLILGTVPGAVLIPAAATQMSANGSFVYVVKEDSTAELRPVALGQRQGDLVIVGNGVKEGERVVLTGQMAVMPGGKVRIEEPPAQQNATAGAAAGVQP